MPRSDTKKSGFFKGVLDGLRSSVTQPVKPEADVEETLRPEHFKVSRTVRHGFPFQPTALAFDPVQRILAIGTKNGSLRLYPSMCACLLEDQAKACSSDKYSKILLFTIGYIVGLQLSLAVAGHILNVFTS